MYKPNLGPSVAMEEAEKLRPFIYSSEIPENFHLHFVCVLIQKHACVRIHSIWYMKVLL